MNNDFNLSKKRLFSFVFAFVTGGVCLWVWMMGLNTIHSTANAANLYSLDVLNETLKISPRDGNINDQFGNALVQDGNTLVIGAYKDNDGGIDAGAVYIYEQNSSNPISWTLSLKLVVSDSVPLANFGTSIDLDGNLLAVGAPSDNGEIGSVYIFDRDLGGPNNWGQVVKLSPVNGEAGDYFGVSIALQEDILFVGAYGDDTQAGDAGIVYIFRRNEGGPDNWGFVKNIFSKQTDHGDNFGSSMALDGDTLVVGAPFDDIVGANRIGSVSVFQRDEGGADNWGEVKIVRASDPVAEDYFGTSVTISGDYIAVGAIEQDAFGGDSGATYVFFRNQGGDDMWGEVKKLLSSEGGGHQRYGASVSMLGQLLLVGESEDNSAFQTGNGAAYLYNALQGGIGNWGEVSQLLASDGENLDGFGAEVWISPIGMFVGARLDDDHGDNSGSVYFFSLPDSASAIFLPVVLR